LDYPVLDTQISPEGRLDVLSKAEINKLLDTSHGGLYTVFRHCTLAVLNSGNALDDGKELLARYPDFSISILLRERGIKLDIRNAPAIGERLFLNTCAQCHGSDAQGNKGFPNLTDKDWLYGGDPATIELTISQGRHGIMPPMGAAVGTDDDVRNVANYVLSLSDSAHDPIKAAFGKPKFAICAACHGPEGKGNQAIGAPNLTDKIWLYGGDIDTIMDGINHGHNNTMPAHKTLLGDAKVHLLAAYVWSLSNSGGLEAEQKQNK